MTEADNSGNLASNSIFGGVEHPSANAICALRKAINARRRQNRANFLALRDVGRDAIEDDGADVDMERHELGTAVIEYVGAKNSNKRFEYRSEAGSQRASPYSDVGRGDEGNVGGRRIILGIVIMTRKSGHPQGRREHAPRRQGENGSRLLAQKQTIRSPRSVLPSPPPTTRATWISQTARPKEKGLYRR